MNSSMMASFFSSFQFTHPGRGATVIDLPVVSAALVFQFTHPGRGATTLLYSVVFLFTGFNSRTPGGVRPIAKQRGKDSD